MNYIIKVLQSVSVGKWHDAVGVTIRDIRRLLAETAEAQTYAWGDVPIAMGRARAAAGSGK